MNNLVNSMVLISFILFRIVLSIVSYEVYFKKNMGELSQKLLEEESQKDSKESRN
jgi:hypothetical protein